MSKRYLRFSQRKGYTPVREKVQIEGMSPELRNSLWNVLDVFLFRAKRPHSFTGYFSPSGYDEFRVRWIGQSLWIGYFKRPLDTLPSSAVNILGEIRKYFFSCKWFEVYDLLEFILREAPVDKALIRAVNQVLEEELSAYRFIESAFVQITDSQEIEALEAALVDDKFPGVTKHLRRALELLSDRKRPDYRNSIKESISAVESISRAIVGEEKATLGDALKKLERNGKLHPALKEAFVKLYGYTSDEDGIRHAMLEEPDLTADDAKFFLVSCTAFVNYLKTKLAKQTHSYR